MSETQKATSEPNHVKYRLVLSPCGSRKSNRLLCIIKLAFDGLLAGSSIFLLALSKMTSGLMANLVIVSMVCMVLYLVSARVVVLDSATKSISFHWRVLDLFEVARRSEPLEKYYGVRVRYNPKGRSYSFLVELVGLYGANLVLRESMKFDEMLAIRDEVVDGTGLSMVEDPFYKHLYDQFRRPG